MAKIGFTDRNVAFAEAVKFVLDKYKYYLSFEKPSRVDFFKKEVGRVYAVILEAKEEVVKHE